MPSAIEAALAEAVAVLTWTRHRGSGRDRAAGRCGDDRRVRFGHLGSDIWGRISGVGHLGRTSGPAPRPDPRPRSAATQPGDLTNTPISPPGPDSLPVESHPRLGSLYPPNGCIPDRFGWIWAAIWGVNLT